ncbi:MAG: PKD domain-containing protein [Fusobacteria bacterium]|nr:PKD domain-containing protein [Fusobacteriota bacterium]
MKKTLSYYFIFFILILMTGCFSSSSSGNKIVDIPKDDDIVVEKPINISIVSAPPKEKSNLNVDIQYIATQEGYNPSDFLYKYELKEGGILSKKEEGISYTKVKFSNLKESTQYSFQVWGINKRTLEVSKTSSITTFTTMSDADQKIDLEINSINFSRVSMEIGDTIDLTYSITNKGTGKHEFLPMVSFGTWNDYFKGIQNEEIWELDAGERKIFTISYELKQVKPNALNAVETVYVTPTILDLNTEKSVTYSQLLTKEITIIIDKNAKIELKEVALSSSSVVPGQSNINIRYDIKNSNTDEYLTIKSITPNFYTEKGVNVSNEWVDSRSEEKRIPPGSEMTITRTYTLSPNATTGKIYLDASVIGEIGGITVEDEHSEKIGIVEVRDVSTANIEAWIAYPDGAKDGEVSAGQSFTVYYRVNYDGNVTIYEKGDITIDYSELDGATLLKGNKNESIEFNQKKEWEVKMPSIEIKGNIKIKINKEPTYRVGEDEFSIKFSKNEILIPINVKKKPELELTVGYSELNYGALDGIVKSGSEFEVYAEITNTNPKNKISGKIKIAINPNSIEGLRFANDEVSEKYINIDEKITWRLIAPSEKKYGTIKFEIKEYPIEPNSNEQYEIRNKDLIADFRLGGDLTLKRIYSDWSHVNPGQSGIPIKFEIRNNGDEDVRVTDVAARFTQNGKDISDKWTLVETTIRENTVITDLNSEITIIAYYKLKENIHDGTDKLGEVVVSGSVKGVELTSGNILIDEYPTYDMIIKIRDIIPPTAIITVDKEVAKVGEPIFFDGTNSFDNDEIAYYAWDFNLGDGILESVRESKIDHTYNEPGEYEVMLQINDREGNGPVTKTIKILIVEDENSKPTDTNPIVAKGKISYQNAPENDMMLVGFDGSESSPSNLSYIWTFRDIYGEYIASKPGQTVSVKFPISPGFNKGDTIGEAILTVMDTKTGKTAIADTIYVKIP